jgi:hypothetical protein
MGRRGQITALLVIAVLAVAAGPARADQTLGAAAVVPLTPPPPPSRVWYGWKVMTVDLVALGAAIAAERTESVTLGLGAISVYGLVSPLMHAHHSGWRSLASLALRAGLPFIGFFATFSYDCAGDHDTPSSGSCSDGSKGIIVGAAAAMILDDLFAFDDVTPALVPAPRAATRASSVTPTLTFNRGMPGLGLVGTF